MSFESSDLNNFRPFDNSLYFLINLLLPSFLSISLVASNLLATNTYNNIVVFSINVSDMAILLKP